jgi:TetR/AcrR family transcriptional regulator, mexJK operon transcriptional repressor
MSKTLSIANSLPRLTRTAQGRAAAAPSKQQEVLDVASEYFLTHGYEGASINAMARSSGISKESIYRYFSSKKELFEAVIDRELVEYQERLRALDSTIKSTDLRSALIALSATVLGEITTDRMLALRRLIFEEATRSPCVGQHYYQIGPEQAYARLEAMFEAHVDQVEFDFRSLSRHFIALLSHRVMLARECRVQSEPTPAEIKVLAAEIVDDFLKAFVRRT